ncbi:ABC transporter permease [Serinicoccus chungangensis]|uniref:ABC transporter permease n=1 Tax=Serinicoccus chungangensis TaxID=767452 RepID=A0A0W8I202_9MICO|nr:ABC transporter permease [Serinicoccus chungangensis]KUG51628.1 ABC transporter permease [Serinicoccus chungangensis]
MTGDGWREVAGARSRPWAGTRRAEPRGGSGPWWAVLGGVVVLVLLLGAGADDQRADFAQAFLPPSAQHPFGTDQAGRDLLARSLAGARVSLLVGLVAALVSSVVGVVVGGLAGSLATRGGGVVDGVLMRVVDAVNALPHLVLGIVIVALLGPSLGSVILSVALTHWTTTARLVRAELLALEGVGFVEAAVGAGAGRWWVLSRHLLAHVMGRVVLATVLMVPHAIMHESALSFLGLGLPDDQASLGTIIEQSRTAVLAGHWWPAVLPGLLLVALSLVVFVLGERLRPVSWGRS